MATTAEIQTRIDSIDAILAEGVSSTWMGDRRVEYDLDALRKERDRLSRIIANSSGSQYKRVVFKSA